MLNVTVDKKRNILTVEIPLQAPAPSMSGKTLIVASTRGFMRSAATLDGKPLSVSLNVTIPK